MNTILKKLAFISLFLFLFQTLSFGKNPGFKHHKSAPAIFTIFHLTPKQFSKGWTAERNEYKSQKHASTRKMMKKQKGSWIQRWYNRNF